MSGPPVRIWSGPVRGPEFRTNLILVRSGGPEFRTKLYWSGPVVRNSGPSNIGPVRWSGIPDQLILVRSGGPGIRTNLFLVRSGGPEFRTGPSWSGFLVRKPGPPDRTSKNLVRSGFFFLIFKLKKNENPCFYILVKKFVINFFLVINF